MPFSICGTTVAVLNTVYCWENGYVITILFKYMCINSCNHKMIYMKLTSPQCGMETLFWFGMCWWPEGVVVSWCCCVDIFLRTRITLLESRQLMQLPFSCLRKPVPFEVPRSTEHTGYLLYIDLLFWMDHVEWKHISKGLCRIPAFLDNLETQLECLDFPDPKLELPTAIGTRSKAKPEGRGWTDRV